MLIKLLKYEFKATARVLVPLYLAILLFGVISRFINPFNVLSASKGFNLQAVLSLLSIFLYIGLIISVMIMTFIIMIQRFYKNLLGDEGYLMFTLPVKPWQQIISKLLVSMLWMMLSYLTVICSILILANINNLFGEIANMFNSVHSYIGTIGLILIPIYVLVAMAYSIITIYDSITLGHLFTKHKILASFGAYIMLYTINQIVIGIFMALFAATNNMLNSAYAPTASQIITLAISFICIIMLLAAGNFTLTNVVLKKKLNLE